MAPIDRMAKVIDSGVAARKFLGDLVRVVRRSVVDDQHPNVDVWLREDALDAFWKEMRVVIARDNHVDSAHG